MDTVFGPTTGASLLLVEDESVVSMAEAKLLTSWGHRVRVVDSGEAAILAVQEEPEVDLVLMDISLGPGMDGFTAAERISREFSLPIVFLTSHLDKSYLLRAQSIDTYYGYIIKNGDEITLRESVRVALHLSRAYRQVALAEDRYHSLFANSPVATVLVDEDDGVIHAANAAACRLYGYSEEQLTGRPIGELCVNPSALNDVLREPGQASRSIEQKTADGSRRVVRFGLSRNGPEHGALLYVTLEDVTEREAAREALAASQAALRSLVDEAPVGIFRTHSNGVPLEANQAMADILGCRTPAETLAHYRNLAEMLYIDPNTRQSFLSRLQREGALRHLEFQARRADDTLIWLRLDVRLANAQPDGSFEIEGFATDITEEKLREAELRRAEEFSRLLAERVPSLVFLYDIAAGMTRWVNRSLREALVAEGLKDPQRVSERQVMDLIHPGDRRKLVAYRSRIARGDDPGNDLLIRFSSHGEWHWFTLRVLVFEYDYPGRPLTLLGILTEVDRLKDQADEALSRLEQSVTTLNETNHRVKNNLALVSALLSLQETARGVDLSDARQQIETIARVHERLLRSRAGVDIPLREQLLEVVRAAVGAHPGIQLENAIEEMQVSSREAVTLGLLVNELVTNARKHALDDGGLLRVHLRRQDHERVVLEVANSGRPLPEHIEPATAASMGMQLITTLAAQLGGTVRAERGALTRFVAELRLPG